MEHLEFLPGDIPEYHHWVVSIDNEVSTSQDGVSDLPAAGTPVCA